MALPAPKRTLLRRRLEERLTSEPHIRLRYFCSPHHRDSVLHPFIAQLEHAAGFAREEEPAVKIEKLAELLSRSRDNAPETAALFADLLGLPTNASLPSDPRQKRELTLAALLQQLEEGLARQQPVLLVFEDAQWGDQTSLELLERAAERVPKLLALMVITFRPEFDPPWTGQAQVTSLTLSRLGQRDTASLVERLAEGKRMPSEITDRIVERTDGIPLFIEELTKTLLKAACCRRRITGTLSPARCHLWQYRPVCTTLCWLGSTDSRRSRRWHKSARRWAGSFHTTCWPQSRAGRSANCGTRSTSSSMPV